MSEENKNTEGFGFKVKEEKATGIMGAQKEQKTEEAGTEEAAPPVVESTTDETTTEETTTEEESSQEVQGADTDTSPDNDGEGHEDTSV